MAHELSEQQLLQRTGLFQLWYFGYCAAPRMNDVDPKKPSTAAHVMFCTFIRRHHPHLRLNDAEIGLTDCMSNPVPQKLDDELEPLLKATARETRIDEDLTRAACHGNLLARSRDEDLTKVSAASVLEFVMEKLHADFEKSLADPTFIDRFNDFKNSLPVGARKQSKLTPKRRRVH